jgi:membrane protease YdiL (CAAX protease family)
VSTWSAPSKRIPPAGPHLTADSGDTPSFSRLLAAGTISECALLVLALGLGRLGGVSVFQRLRLDVDAAVVGAAAALPMLALLLWCLRTTWGPMRSLVAMVEERLGPHLTDASAGGIVLLAALAGVGEELLFRGVIQIWLAERAPLWLAVGAASLLFGVGHWLSASYAVLASFIGAYLGIVFLLADNLVAPIIAHAAYDVVALLVLARRAAPSGGQG